MNMEKLFSTKERVKILNDIILKTGSIGVNNVATRLALSKGLVSKYFDILAKENILVKNNEGIFVTDSPMVKAVKVLLNIKSINTSIFKQYKFVKSVGLYGSCAKGENTEESDVDMWVRICDVKDEEIASLTSKLRKRINNIKPIFLTDKKIEKLMENDELFYHALSFGSIVIYGDKDGIQL